MGAVLRSATVLALAVGSLTAGPAERAEAQVQAGIVLDRDGLRAFHLAVGHVYGVPVTRVQHHAPTWLPPEELPVVYLLAREARVSPDVIIALREAGWSWLDITDHMGISPAIFVRHLPTRVGPPYGVAHGYWRKPHRSRYRHLSDRHIIDFVNVYLWSEYYRRPVTEVIVVREYYGGWAPLTRPRYWSQVPALRGTVVQGIPGHPGGHQAAPPPRQAVPRGSAPAPSRAAPAPSRQATPSRAAPAPSRQAAPSRAAPAPSRQAAPSRAAPAPSRQAAPSRAAPAPSRQAAPSRAAPAPSRQAAPSRAAPAPSRQAAPSRAAPAPSRQAAPSRAAPAPSRQAAPSRARPAPARPAASSAPSTRSSPPAAQTRSGGRDARPARPNRPPSGGG